MCRTFIAPSVLAADFANLPCDCEMLNRSDADWFHIDIMDGVFWRTSLLNACIELSQNMLLKQ
jgi:pentose-5-phosphate-3-epimerase